MNDARLRGKSQAIQHNSALPKMCQSLRRASLGCPSLRALRVRVMVCYVLRPCAAKGVSRRVAWVWLARCARGWHTPNLWAALPRLRRARWPASPVVSWQTAVPPASTFGILLSTHNCRSNHREVNVGYLNQAAGQSFAIRRPDYKRKKPRILRTPR